jgi:hypothetical protein
MNTDLTSIIVTIVSSGVGAGIVTFCMNFWKAELDFRRVKIEELYAAVHKYTLEMQLLSANMRTGKVNWDNTSKVFATGDFDRISLLIDLYFPRLHPTFKQFTLAMEAFIVRDAKFRTDEEGFAEDWLHIGNIGEKLKQEVVALSRERSLRALIEAVQDYDKNHVTA